MIKTESAFALLAAVVALSLGELALAQTIPPERYVVVLMKQGAFQLPEGSTKGLAEFPIRWGCNSDSDD